jgi:flagellar biogenesis protein FliO
VIALASWAPGSGPIEPVGLEWWRALLALVIVAGLLAALVVLARKGALGRFARSRHAGISVETIVPLGERRSLLIVDVEGRRLLLGASPVNVSLVTELGPRPAFDATLSQTVARTGEPPR